MLISVPLFLYIAERLILFFYVLPLLLYYRETHTTASYQFPLLSYRKTHSTASTRCTARTSPRVKSCGGRWGTQTPSSRSASAASTTSCPLEPTSSSRFSASPSTSCSSRSVTSQGVATVSMEDEKHCWKCVTCFCACLYWFVFSSHLSVFSLFRLFH